MQSSYNLYYPYKVVMIFSIHKKKFNICASMFVLEQFQYNINVYKLKTLMVSHEFILLIKLEPRYSCKSRMMLI